MKLIFKTILLIILTVLVIIFASCAIYVGFKFFTLLFNFIISGEVPHFTITIK